MKIVNRYSALFAFVSVAFSAHAQQPTFHQDIAPIIYNNCNPVFLDSDNNYNLDLAKLKTFFASHVVIIFLCTLEIFSWGCKTNILIYCSIYYYLSCCGPHILT